MSFCSGKKDVRTVPGSSALFRDVFLRLPEVLNSLMGGENVLSDHLLEWLRRCARACFNLAEFEQRLIRSNETQCTRRDLSLAFIEAIRQLVTVFDDSIVTRAFDHCGDVARDVDDGVAQSESESDSAAAAGAAAAGAAAAARAARAAAAAAADQRSQGERLLILPKTVDAQYAVVAAQLVAPYRILSSLGAMGELGHQDVKFVAKKSGRRDHVFVKTVLSADFVRWWLRRLRVRRSDDDDDEVTRSQLTTGNIVPLMDGREPVQVLPLVVEAALGGAPAVRLLLDTARLVRLRGLHVDSHRVYSQKAIDSGVAEVNFAPLMRVQVGSREDGRPYGVLLDIIAVVDVGPRGALTQRSGRRASRVFLVLAEFKRTGKCGTCNLDRFCGIRQRKLAVELKNGVRMAILPTNDKQSCPKLPTESRDDPIRHWNTHLDSLKANCRGW